MISSKRNLASETIRYFIILILTIFFLELLTRTFFFITLKEINFIKYGFKKDLEIHTLDLSKFEISIFDRNIINLNIPNQLEEKKFKSNKEILAWTFGGSTTKGYNCGSDSSSWPEQLKKINNSINVLNFAENGYSTDKSIPLLWKNLKKNSPEIIFWAHKFNISKATSGLTRNKNLINHEFKNQKANKLNLTIKEIDKTLKDKLLFYYFFDQIIIRINIKFNVFEASQEYVIEKKDWEVAVKNFEINTAEAIKLSKENMVSEFYIVSLFSEKELKGNKDYFNILYDKTLNFLEKETYAKIIYLNKDLEGLDPKKYFCDGMHKTYTGNLDTAKKINKYFINHSKFFINQ